MKMTLQTIMQKMASYVELVLSAFLLLVVVALSVRLIAQSVPQVWSQQIDVMYYLESAMTLAIGIEFVKMLCTHTSETIIEILLFAISRQVSICCLQPLKATVIMKFRIALTTGQTSSAGNIFGSLVVTTKTGIPVKIVFVRNRNKKSECLYLLSTDTSLNNAETRMTRLEL